MAIVCPYCTKLSIISFKHWILTSFQVSSAFPANFLVLEILNGKAKDMLQCGVCQMTYSLQRIPRIHPSCGRSVCEDCKEQECKTCEPPNEQSLYRLVMARLGRNGKRLSGICCDNWVFQWIGSQMCPLTTQSEIFWRSNWILVLNFEHYY